MKGTKTFKEDLSYLPYKMNLAPIVGYSVKNDASGGSTRSIIRISGCCLDCASRFRGKLVLGKQVLAVFRNGKA